MSQNKASEGDEILNKNSFWTKKNLLPTETRYE